jgi:hypothetical protein
MRLFSRLAALAAFGVTAVGAPAAAQPACVPGTGADYLLLGIPGCTVGGIRFTGFDYMSTSRSPDATLITPGVWDGVIGFRMQIRPIYPLFESAATAFPAPVIGEPFVAFEYAVFQFSPVVVTPAALVVHPLSLDGQAASADPGWTAFSRAVASASGQTLWAGILALGGPGVTGCVLQDVGPVACDVAHSRFAYDGGGIRVDLLANITALPVPATGGASAQTLGIVLGLAPLQTVPEPGTWALFGGGLALLAGARGRRRR